MKMLLNFLLFLLLFLLIGRSCYRNPELSVMVEVDITGFDYNEMSKCIKATMKFDFVYM